MKLYYVFHHQTDKKTFPFRMPEFLARGITYLANRKLNKKYPGFYDYIEHWEG